MSAEDEAIAYLATTIDEPDERIDLADTALALAALDQPGEGDRPLEMAPYRRHLATLASDVADALADPARFGEDPLAAGIGALQDVLVNRHGYVGDSQRYDDLDNANLMRVIDRRRGLPVALGILWIHAARSAGMQADGLAFPGHFLIRIERDQETAILDPFGAGRVLRTADLQRLLRTMSDELELSPEHWSPVSNRAVLLRLQNNIKTRLIQTGDLARAAGTLQRMTLIEPHAAELWYELASLYAETGMMQAAIGAAEKHALLAPMAARGRAEALLLQFRQRLH